MKRLFRSVLACACLLLASQAFAQTNVAGTISAASTDCTTNSSCVVLQMPSNGGGVALRITGTFSATLQFEASVGGNTFAAIAGGPLSGGSAVTSATSTGSWQFNTAGVASFRVRASAYVSGGAVIFIQSSAASPSGSTSVTGGTAVQVCASDLMTCAPVDGTLGLKVQASIDTTGLATSANQSTELTKLNGGLPAALGTGGGLKIDGSGTALPISGTVTVTGNAGLADGGTFTAGSTSDTPVAGLYESSPSTCASGKACALGLTTNREIKIAIPNSGAIASGAFSSGAFASGAFASGSVASGALASGSVADGAIVTIGSKTDAANTATNGTSISVMQVLKEISAMEQAPATRAVTNAGTFAVQATLSAETTKQIGVIRLSDNSGSAFAANNPVPTRSTDGTNYITDAAIGAALSSNPIPIACHNETSPTTIGNTQAGVPECDTSQRLIVVSPTAGNFLTTTRLQDGSGNLINSTSNALNVQCANCSGSGVSTADEATFTAGSSVFVGMGGFFQTTATNNALTTGQQGMAQMTATRAVFSNLRNASGTEIGTSSNPVNVAAPSGAIASGAIASGAIASGAVASGAVASGAFASGSISDGAEVTLGAKADAKSTATDTTAITAMQVLKEISFMEQTPASRAVTNAGTFATQSAITAASGSIASGAIASGAVASGAIASGAFAAGSLNSAIPDPCLYTAKTPYPISISTATTTVVQAASSSNKFRICSIFLFASAAENVALVEDATGSCASPDAGMMGGTTSGTGINLTANQGWTLGSGLATIAQTASTNVNVCLITSSTAQLSGTIMGVLAP